MQEQPIQVQEKQAAGPQNVMPQLKEQPNFLAVRYNQTKKQQRSKGGAYVPPHKLRQMQQKIMEQDPNSIDHQRMMWQLLRKSINGIVNKVNISNIQNIVIQLFNENILRGIGLLTKAIIKAQMASPNFTHVYAALVAVINTKLPEIGNLLITRVMIMFNRSFRRNNKIVCMATTKMIAHLVNQKILGEFAALQLLMILLMHATEDSVEIACDFMTEVGQVLSQVSPAAASAIFQRFKNLLHEGQIGQKAQYSIQKLFAIRKTGFKNHPGIIPQLDLVQAEDQITHNLDFQQQLKGQQNLNFFRVDSNYAKTQQQWDAIKLQILGQQNIINLKQVTTYQQQVQQYDQQQEQQGIKDLTQQDLINLRRTIYLAIQSTVNFQECAHKILKMKITKGYQSQLIDMIIQCCMMERIYQEFFGLLAQRFCKIDDTYKELFVRAFVNYYNTIFKMEVNKIRNLAKLYGHLFYTFSIDWKIMEIIILKQDSTTSAHRMFLKILFRQIAQNLGVQMLTKQFKNPQMRGHFSGLFPIGHPNDVRFAINYWTTIGLGPLTQELRQVLQLQEQMIADRRQREQRQRMQQLMREEQEMLMAEEQRALEEERLKYEEEQKIKKQYQIKKQKQQNQRNKTKQRERERERQRQRQRQKRKQRQRERSRQIRRDRQREKQKQRQRSRQRQRQRERQKYRQREKQISRRQAQQRRKDRRRQSSSSSQQSSSSSSESQQTPKRGNSNEKNQVPTKLKQQRVLQQQDASQDQSQSSGIQSQSDQDKKQLSKNVPSSQKVKDKLKKQASSSQSSKSSSSSSSSKTPVRKRQSNDHSRKKAQQNRRRISSSQSQSQSPSKRYHGRTKNYESTNRRR